jgi:hypothetical protein
MNKTNKQTNAAIPLFRLCLLSKTRRNVDVRLASNVITAALDTDRLFGRWISPMKNGADVK